MHRKSPWSLVLALGLSAACVQPPPAPELDDPLPGLSDDELERFEQGEAIFEGTFTAAQGLGPLFNAEGCAVCHSEPTDGGSGPLDETHVSGIGDEGECDSLLERGGPVVQERATPALQALGIEREPLPAGVTASAQRTTPDVFGFGLIDAIPDMTLLALADPDDRDGDGISGRANVLPGGHVGRFGRKAAGASLAAFNAGAFRIEMGLTSSGEPFENTLAGQPLPTGVDPLAEPELSAETIARVNDYVRFLAPPAPARLVEAGQRGKILFERVGCAACHVPSLRTGDHEVRALRNQVLFAYSDFLLHDMGPELADICMADAESAEFRTEPLMGLRHNGRFLHDGRAATIRAAIDAHGGEAALARDAFVALGERERAALLAFLGSL
ncbi:MAG: hypothetical protein EXS08_11100 [Planctomycetes bacterium]|nr:hypothetical protein [Planctomycetota bacterium]